MKKSFIGFQTPIKYELLETSGCLLTGKHKPS
jgi:hypothetical protein